MSTNSTIQWSYVQCLNFTANGTYVSDDANAGGTSLSGTNQSQLESMFNINYTDVDGVDETFTLAGANTHDAFYTGYLQFTEGECKSTRIYSNAGSGENNKFEERAVFEAYFAESVEAALSGLSEPEIADWTAAGLSGKIGVSRDQTQDPPVNTTIGAFALADGRAVVLKLTSTGKYGWDLWSQVYANMLETLTVTP